MTWHRVSLVGSAGELRAPGHVVAGLRRDGASGVVLLTGHLLGAIPGYANLLCRTMAGLGRPWCAEADPLHVDRDLLRLARRSGCRALVLGPDPDPLRRSADGDAHPDRLAEAAADLRRIRRAGLLSVVHLRLGQAGDDAGIFARAVRLCLAGRVAFPRLEAESTALATDLAPDDVASGVAWARRTLYGHRAVWRRVGLLGRLRPAALLANYRTRRTIVTGPRLAMTPAMRLARALARPIRVRERVAFVSILVGAMHAQSGRVRNAWLRARATHDRTLAALVIRLEGALDARAARTLVARVRRAIGRTPERIIVDLGGLELVSSTVLTRFLAEHAAHLEALRGRLAFRNLRPALEALRRNLHGMLPNAELLEQALDEG